jgi:hypothetical protein
LQDKVLDRGYSARQRWDAVSTELTLDRIGSQRLAAAPAGETMSRRGW